jgi:hypothetical protein
LNTKNVNLNTLTISIKSGHYTTGDKYPEIDFSVLNILFPEGLNPTRTVAATNEQLTKQIESNLAKHPTKTTIMYFYYEPELKVY